MRYFMFIDETGDHGLSKINKQYPVFVLNGVIISEDEYSLLTQDMDGLKSSLFGDTNVIFHSKKVRNNEGAFKILFNEGICSQFYATWEGIVTNRDFAIIASGIIKDEYVRRVGRLCTDVYSLSLSFIMERAIFYLDDMPGTNNTLHLIIEERGTYEDAQLKINFDRLLVRGTGYVTPKRFANYKLAIAFRKKSQNINGLQMSDMTAYPIARHAWKPHEQYIPYDICRPKIYTKNGVLYGVKIYPEK